MNRLAVSWVLMGLVLVTFLAVGALAPRGPRTEAERVRAIASTVRCPTCRGLSAAESDAKAAVAVRDEITRRVRAGESATEIRAFLVSRYGEDIVLTPEGSGLSALVWAVPVVVLVLAGAALAAAFAKWRGALSGEPTSEDEALVAAARGSTP